MSEADLVFNRHTGVTEVFSIDRLSTSLKNACRAVGLSDGVVHDTAHRVSSLTQAWLAKRQEATTDDIRRVAAQHLSVVSAEAGYLYQSELAII